jgi:hypothetical protein
VLGRKASTTRRLALLVATAITAMLVVSFGVGPNLAPIATADDFNHYYSYGYLMDADSNYCLDDEVIGGRSWAVYHPVGNITYYNEFAGSSLWLETDQGCGNDRWVEVGLHQECDNESGCSAEHPAVNRVYVGKSRGRGTYHQEYPGPTEAPVVLSDGDVVDLVLTRDSDNGTLWWAGVSSGTSRAWYFGRQVTMANNDLGHGLEVGEELYTTSEYKLHVRETDFQPQSRMEGGDWEPYPYADRTNDEPPYGRWMSLWFQVCANVAGCPW